MAAERGEKRDDGNGEERKAREITRGDGKGRYGSRTRQLRNLTLKVRDLRHFLILARLDGLGAL